LQKSGLSLSFLEHNSESKTRLIKFFLIGGLNYPVNVILVWFGKEKIGLDYLVSAIIAYSIITITNFFWHSNYIFHSKRSKAIFIKYLSSIMVFYIAYIAFLMILTDWLNFYYLLSVIISISILFLIKFYIFNNYVFISLDDNK